MNLKRPSLKGPKLNAPGLKPPDFLADVYYDLRERRLLPLVALIAVAIVAVPFLLGADSEVAQIEATAPPEEGATTVEAGAALAVVESKPGLRDYTKRLQGSPTDPFVQKYTGVPSQSKLQSTSAGDEDISAGKTGGGDSTAGVDSDGGEPSGGSGGSGGSKDGSGGQGAGAGGGSGNSGGRSGIRFFGYRPNIRFGLRGSDKLTVYKHLGLGKLLPKEKPVLVFIGVSEDGKRVAFDLTREVTRVAGPGRCVGGKDECNLLILKAGQAVDIFTGSPSRSFRLHVVRVEFIEVDRPKPAKSSAAKARGLRDEFAQNFSK